MIMYIIEKKPCLFKECRKTSCFGDINIILWELKLYLFAIIQTNIKQMELINMQNV